MCMLIGIVGLALVVVAMRPAWVPVGLWLANMPERELVPIRVDYQPRP